MSTSVPPTGTTPAITPPPPPPPPPPVPPLPTAPSAAPAAASPVEGATTAAPTAKTGKVDPAALPPDKAAKPEAAQKTEKAEKPVKPIDLKDEYENVNKGKDGLNKSELKLLDKSGAIKDYDKDDDGEVSLKEYRARQREQNSFKGLDADKDGKLSEDEMSKLRRVTSEDDNAFDADGNGEVSRDEFKKARMTDIRKNREARREQDFKKLSDKEMDKLADDKRYDGDGDGKVSIDEFHKGRVQEWRDNRDKKMNHLFEEAGAKDGALSVKDAEQYKSYDEDGDGKISKEEFKTGFMADRKDYWDQHVQEGEISKELKKRLGLDELGLGLNHIEKEKDEAKADGKVDGETMKTPEGLMYKRGDEWISERIVKQYDQIVAAAKKDGVNISLVSGYRSHEEQEALYQAYLNGTGNLAAKPGTSNHEHGDAIDVENSPGAYDWMKNNAHKYGLKNLPSEPWHYSPTGT